MDAILPAKLIRCFEGGPGLSSHPPSIHPSFSLCTQLLERASWREGGNFFQFSSGTEMGPDDAKVADET